MEPTTTSTAAASRSASVDAGLLRPERSLGQSTANYNIDSSSAKMARVFRKHQGLPVNMCVRTELEGDNAKAYFNRYCRFLGSRLIPIGYDDNLQPRNPANKRCLVTETLLLYIGNHLMHCRRMFPGHEDWANDKAPIWWTQMRLDFTKECDAFQQKSTGDVVFGMGDTTPLYRCIKDPPLPVNLSGPIDDYVSSIDLRYLLRKLASEKGSLMDRVLVGMTYMCIGRGGEIKFQNFNDWNWDPKLESLDPRWHEIKIIDTYPMPLIPDKEYWETDVYHQLACYFSVEDGLFRSREQVAAGLLNTVFPSLNSSADSYVARRISTIIRRTLPEGCPDSVKGGYTARSVRKGSITDLSMHPQLNSLRIAARSGHSTGCTLDSYLDKNNPARCLHAALGAAGWSNVENRVRPYRLEAIGDPVQTAKFTSKLFACSVPYFNKCGKLHIVLKTCAAAMLMYHPRVSRDLGANAISDKVRTAARSAGIKDDRFPDLSPELVVNEWAKIVERDFKQMNTETATVGQDAASMAAGIESILKFSAKIASDVADLKTSHEALTLENASHKARITSLDNELHSVRGELRHANHKLSQLRTPEKKKSPPQGLPNIVDLASESGPTELSTVTASVGRSVVSRESVNTRLSYSAAADELSKKKKKKAAAAGKHTETDRTLGSTLMSLARNGVLRDPFAKTELAKGFHEGHHLKHCFDLIDFVKTPEMSDDKLVLINDGDDTVRLQAAHNIESLCFDKLLELEGKDVAFEKKNKRSRKKPTYIAMGGRIQGYKKLCQAAGGPVDNTSTKPKVVLIDLKTLKGLQASKAAGSLPGHRRVSTYFPTRKRKAAPVAVAAKRRRLERPFETPAAAPRVSQDDGYETFGI